MATKSPETVEIPAATLAALQARIDSLELAERIRQEGAGTATRLGNNVIDQAYTAWKEEAGRPAAVRTQEAADKKYGTTGPRFSCRMDSTGEDGRKGPDISCFPVLDICANSDLEAGARYLQICGITQTAYPVRATPVAA